MRDNGPHHQSGSAHRATTAFRGRRWSIRRFPTRAPASRRSGWRTATGLLIYNDLPRGRHSLAVSVSDDEGASWKWTRHLERWRAGQGQFHYPSIIQAADGSIHVTYTYSRPGQGSTIEHARFNEAWLKAGRQELTRQLDRWLKRIVTGTHPRLAGLAPVLPVARRRLALVLRLLQLRGPAGGLLGLSAAQERVRPEQDAARAAGLGVHARLCAGVAVHRLHGRSAARAGCLITAGAGVLEPDLRGHGLVAKFRPVDLLPRGRGAG